MQPGNVVNSKNTEKDCGCIYIHIFSDARGLKYRPILTFKADSWLGLRIPFLAVSILGGDYMATNFTFKFTQAVNSCEFNQRNGHACANETNIGDQSQERDRYINSDSVIELKIASNGLRLLHHNTESVKMKRESGISLECTYTSINIII